MKLYTTQETFEKSGVMIRESNGFNRIILFCGSDKEFIIPIDEQVNLNQLNCFNLEQYRASKCLRIIPATELGDNSILLIGQIQAERGHSLIICDPYLFEVEILYQNIIQTPSAGWTLYIAVVIRPQNNLILEEHLITNNKDPDYIIYTNEKGNLRKYKLTQPEYESLLREQDRKWGARIF
jgi:hypothetical protein